MHLMIPPGSKYARLIHGATAADRARGIIIRQMLPRCCKSQQQQRCMAAAAVLLKLKALMMTRTMIAYVRAHLAFVKASKRAAVVQFISTGVRQSDGATLAVSRI